MKTVVINGKTMRVNGSVSIINGKVLCNGKPIEDLESIDEKVINISINGDVEKIDVDACDRIDVTGKVNYIKTMSGDIDCGNVGGNASTMSGDVRRK